MSTSLQVGSVPPTMLSSLHLDLFIQILMHLSVNDVMRLLLTKKEFYSLRNELEIWNSICKSYDSGLFCTLRNQHCFPRDINDYPLAADEMIVLARQCEKINEVREVEWGRVEFHDKRCEVEPMEGHTMSKLLERYLIIIGGWADDEPNEVICIDGQVLPERVFRISSQTINRPRFRYGFTTTVFLNRFFIYGGCRQGGYSRDCNDLYEVTFQFKAQDGVLYLLDSQTAGFIRNAPVGYFTKIIATYSVNLTQSLVEKNCYIPHARAYHTMVPAVIDGRPSCLVWGGFHEREVMGLLELLDIETLEWRPLVHTGLEPSSRFGHSFSPLCDSYDSETAGRYLVVSGSDGNDLIRSGCELCDCHMLFINRAQKAGERDTFSWRSVEQCQSNVDRVPGRCHNAVVVGSSIIFFAGGALNSSQLTIADIFTNKDDPEDAILKLRSPHLLRRSLKPIPRLSSTMVSFGRYLVVFGGFNNSRHQLNDFLVLDLAPGVKINNFEFSMTTYEDNNDGSSHPEFENSILHFLNAGMSLMQAVQMIANMPGIDMGRILLDFESAHYDEDDVEQEDDEEEDEEEDDDDDDDDYGDDENGDDDDDDDGDGDDEDSKEEDDDDDGDEDDEDAKEGEDGD